MITPSTTIKFLNVPFSSSQNNVLKFYTPLLQAAYMAALANYTISSCTYQREGDGEYIRVPINIDSLYTCNYVMFQNSNFGERWFYAFIEHMEYLNPSVTKVFIKMDSYQSFMFDYTVENTFIERQTFATDYYNTLPDIPSTGDLTTIFEYSKVLNGYYYLLLNADPTIEDCALSTPHYPTIGDYSIPCYMAIFSTPDLMCELIQAISNKGRADRIQACYFAPSTREITASYSMPKGDLDTYSGNDITLIETLELDDIMEDFTVTVDYTATYKKELSYPYAKLEVVDQITGKSINLDLSKFENPLAPTFRIFYNIGEKPYYKVIPMNYNGLFYSIENALVVEPSTEMPVFSNSYAKYLKNNNTQNMISGGMGVMGAVGSIMTGNVAGAVSSFASIAQVVTADKVASTQPNQINGMAGDAMEYINLSPAISFRVKVMDWDHMKIARNFWYIYGYPSKCVDVLSETGQRFNFYKTVNCNIIATTIPTEYLRDLEEIYNKGVTIWNNNYLNYYA